MKKTLLLFVPLLLIVAACAPQPAQSNETVEPTRNPAEPAIEITVEQIATDPVEENNADKTDAPPTPMVSSVLPKGTSSLLIPEGLLLTLWGNTTGTLNLIDPATGQRISGTD